MRHHLNGSCWWLWAHFDCWANITFAHLSFTDWPNTLVLSSELIIIHVMWLKVELRDSKRCLLAAGVSCSSVLSCCSARVWGLKMTSRTDPLSDTPLGVFSNIKVIQSVDVVGTQVEFRLLIGVMVEWWGVFHCRKLTQDIELSLHKPVHVPTKVHALRSWSIHWLQHGLFQAHKIICVIKKHTHSSQSNKQTNKKALLGYRMMGNKWNVYCQLEKMEIFWDCVHGNLHLVRGEEDS